MGSLIISADGTTKQVNLIPKKQTLYSPKFLSFEPLLSGEKVYYLYFDNKINLTKNITNPNKYKKVRRTKECTLVLSSLDEKGKLSKSQVTSQPVKEGLLMPTYTNRIGESTFFVIFSKAIKGNSTKYQLGTMQLD